MRRISLFVLFLSTLLGVGQLMSQPAAKKYRLPGVDLKPPIIWSSEVELPDGTTLAFGGQDQQGEDGAARTRRKVEGKWQSLTEELRKANPLQGAADRLRGLADRAKHLGAQMRYAYLEGQKGQGRLGEAVGLLFLEVEIWKNRNPQANERLQGRLTDLKFETGNEVTPAVVAALWRWQRTFSESADLLDSEPTPRTLSPLVYEPKTKTVILFGGDHCDFLLADLWVFDVEKKRWSQRFPEGSPPPRANHKWRANGDGTLTLEGGYTYSNTTDYMGGPYQDVGDGPWVYDVIKNQWKGPQAGGSSLARTYRTGPFDPAFFLAGEKPEAAAFQKRLADLAPNTWLATKPPHLPHMNRDWGTAILDPDRDLILRWSGGHSAHGGSDVLHYHLASNRWELPFPVELPLGQTYSNTEYPEGWNLNRRPWVTGHTYQNYGYDPFGKSMRFLGQTRHDYQYDPDLGDWVDRVVKPAGMVYGSCFYTLTTATTPHGLVCWTQAGKLFHLTEKEGWQEIPLEGKLPGAVVDNSTLTWDAKRERLLFIVKPYGKAPFSGEVWSVDWKTRAVKALEPKGRAGVAELPYLCQWRYHAEADLVVAGAWLDPQPEQPRRMAAYDPAANRWVSLAVGGDDPFGKSGRNVSLGMVYDAKRKLFWAVDARSQVFVLRLDVAKAERRELAD